MNDVRTTTDGHVGIAEICRAPNNYFDIALIRDLAAAFRAFDADPAVRCILLAAEGKNFCAGADFSGSARSVVGDPDSDTLYRHAVQMFRCGKPVVAAVQGAAVGGGLGLALVADFRVASPDSRFTANFNRLGFHTGFGLSVTLPRVVGQQQAELRGAAMALATEIAQAAPISLTATRATLRRGLADAVAAITGHELAEQQKHFDTADFKEGVKAMAERRLPVFQGQ